MPIDNYFLFNHKSYILMIYNFSDMNIDSYIHIDINYRYSKKLFFRVVICMRINRLIEEKLQLVITNLSNVQITTL